MGRKERNWHQNFLDYMDMIVNHDNYKGLPIQIKADGQPAWIATSKSEIGSAREKWALNKAEQLGIDTGPGVFAKVMFEIHPTKRKACQICGKEMFIYYIYPNKNFISALKKAFNHNCDSLTPINVVVDNLKASGITNKEIKRFLIDKFSLNEEDKLLTIINILQKCEQKCRDGHSKRLGPGAMSNFPDRYDGFHTYNRCCRSTQDKGRSKDNLKSYNKDRRAYEYWSDGNIHAANKFMNSSFFKGISADHIGPISLGFVHDPRYLRPMALGDNVSKRDRLLFEDIEEIIKVEQRTGINAMSWYSADIWDFIKLNYRKHPEEIGNYRIALKNNMATFMFILWTIMDQCGKLGIDFLAETLLAPKLRNFMFNYKFNQHGDVIKTSKRNITDSTRKEYGRFARVAFEAVQDYNEKENRIIKPRISDENSHMLESICQAILSQNNQQIVLEQLKHLIQSIQHDQIVQLNKSA